MLALVSPSASTFSHREKESDSGVGGNKHKVKKMKRTLLCVECVAMELKVSQTLNDSRGSFPLKHQDRSGPRFCKVSCQAPHHLKHRYSISDINIASTES